MERLLLFLFIICCCMYTQAQQLKVNRKGNEGLIEKGFDVVSLNGQWEMGFSRKYTRTVIVPGIALDPAQRAYDVLWYRKEIELPKGNWNRATLELKGARFLPTVYVNGELVSREQGGMAPVYITLNQGSVKPGNRITLEIALAPLKDVPQTDASYIPGADHWRSNISSCLWDDVVLHLHGDVRIARIIPFVDYNNQTISVSYDLLQATAFKGKAMVQITDKEGNVFLQKMQPVEGEHGRVDFSIDGKLQPWSPESPSLYYLTLSLTNSKKYITDQSVVPFGVKSMVVRNKQFYLNNQHFIPKGVTVVWHRWMRSREGIELGYDTAWFIKNIIQRAKEHGANYLRFHLGTPPERFLDLCDRYGLAVQFEWSFFHGMPASKESLLVQYKSWLDLAMRHPCVSFIHPYNETGGDQLKTAWAALDQLLINYPPLILEDRDVIHIHKYWWSMFENLGIFYDSASVFPKAIMADEFGGNYLDEKGNLGGYPALKETYLRFLGREHSVAERLMFQAQSNARIAEYWRRIGAAGFSPFCALSSYEDGNTWFMGPLKEGNPKPVWNALTAAFSPQSVSIEIWDKNFEPGQRIDLPVYVFNDESKPAALSFIVTLEDRSRKVVFTKGITVHVNAFDRTVQRVPVNFPETTGDYVIKAELINRPLSIKYPVISEWDVRVYRARVTDRVKKLKIAVPKEEIELNTFLRSLNIKIVDLSDPSADIIITALKSWNRLAKGDAGLSNILQKAIAKGKSVVMLDVGDRRLGQGYPDEAGDVGPLQGVVRIADPQQNNYSLFGGITLKFTEAAEPESFIHPDKSNRAWWGNLPEKYTGIWNGMRGGLIVPAAVMEFSGLSSKAFMAQWIARGAEDDKITRGPYFAYALQGFYDFSDQPKDEALQNRLKANVNFRVQDAPALANAINPLTPVTVTDLSKGYRDSEKGMAENFVPLANCAKNLTQTPVALIDFGKGKGALVVSQLLTTGRLANGFGEAGLYGIRYDEVAVQFVLNMIDLSVSYSGKSHSKQVK